MMTTTETDRIIQKIAVMDREALVLMLRSMKCDFPIDFTDEFFSSVNLERLRHIAFAAALHSHSGAA